MRACLLILIEVCIAFIAKPFMEVDISEIAKQMAELFIISTVESARLCTFII